MNGILSNLMEVEHYVTELFRSHQKPALVYHNIDLTVKRIYRIQEIAGNYDLGERQIYFIYGGMDAWCQLPVLPHNGI